MTSWRGSSYSTNSSLALGTVDGRQSTAEFVRVPRGPQCLLHHLDERLGASVNERALSGRPMTTEVTIPIKEYPLEQVPASGERRGTLLSLRHLPFHSLTLAIFGLLGRLPRGRLASGRAVAFLLRR